MCRIANLQDIRPDKRILSIQDEIQLVAYAYTVTARQYSLVYFLSGGRVVLLDPFRVMGEWMKKLHGDLTVRPPLRSRPEVKNGRSSAKDSAPERLRYGTIQKEVS